jgi:hypothetical protein
MCGSSYLVAFPGVAKRVILLRFGAIRLGSDSEEHMVWQVVQVGIEVFLCIFGGNNDSGSGVRRCNRQENLAILFILGCLIGSFLGVCRAKRDHCPGLLPSPFICRENAHMLAVDNLVLTISREF